MLADRWSWAPVLFAAPLLLVPGFDWRLLGLAAVPMPWLAARLAGTWDGSRTLLHPAAVLIGIMTAVTVVVTPDLANSLSKITGVALGLGALSAIARHGRSARGWWTALFLFLFIGCGIAGAGLLVTDWATKIPPLAALTGQWAPRILGIPGIEEGLNPNQLAGALTWAVPPFFCLTAVAWSQRGALLADLGRQRFALLVAFLLAGSAVSAFALILTQSRGAYTGMAVFLAIVPLVLLPEAGRRRYRRMALAIAIPLALATIGFLVWAAQDPSGILPGSLALQLEDSLPRRLQFWQRALAIISDFPITGIGLNSVRLIMPEFYPPLITEPGTLIGHVHNEILQAAVDLGLPGLVAFLTLQFGGLWLAWRSWQTSPTTAALPGWPAATLLPRAAALGLGGGLVAHMVFGLADATALGAKPGILWWMCLGLLAGLFLQARAVSGDLPAQPAAHDLAPAAPNRWLRPVLAAAVSLLCLLLVLRGVSLTGLAATLSHARADLLALAVLAVPVNLAARAMRWRRFFPALSRPSPSHAVTVLGAAQLVNIVAPVRLGEVLRVALMAPVQPGGAAYAVGTIAAEKLCELTAMLASVALLLALMPLPAWITVPASGALAAVLAGVGAVAIASRRGTIESLTAALTSRLPPSAREWTRRQVLRVADSLAVLARPRTLAGAVLWSAIAWLAAVLTNGLTLAALGIALPWWTAVLVLVVTQVGVAVIPSAPGQVGVFHALAVLSLSPFAVAADTALGYAVAVHLAAYLPLTIIGVLTVWRLGLSLDLNRLSALRQGGGSRDR